MASQSGSQQSSPDTADDANLSTHGEESGRLFNPSTRADSPGEAGWEEPQGSQGDMLQLMAREQVAYQNQVAQMGQNIATAVVVANPQQGLRKLRMHREHVKGWLKVIRSDVDTTEKQQPFTTMIKALGQQEEVGERVLSKAVDVSGACQRTMITMAALAEKVGKTFNTSFGQNGQNDSYQLVEFSQWEPQMIKPTMDQVSNCVEELGAKCKELQELGLEPALDSSNQTIRALEEHMYSRDAVQELKKELAEKERLRNVRVEERRKVAEQEGLAGVLQAKVKGLEEKVEAQRQRLEESKSRKTWVSEKVKELENNSKRSMDQAVAELEKLQRDAKEQVAKLRRQKEDAVSQKQSAFETARAEHERKLQALNTELLEVSKVIKNHIIFCIDKSYSMAGPRWREALRALEAFRAVRIQQGALDEVSMILFDHEAKELFCGQPLNSAFVDQVRKEPIGGGTCYAPAWRSVANLSQRGSAGTKLVVVFITDGASYDIPQAAAVAASLHNERKPRGGMSTFVVNVDNGVRKEVLQPVVLAGNGGQDSMKAAGEWIYLSASVFAPEMSIHFQKLASLIDWQEESVKHRIGLLEASEQGDEQRLREHLALLDEQANLRLQSIEVVCNKAKDANEEDAKGVKKMLDEQIAQLRAEGASLDDAIAEQSEELAKREAKLAKAQQELKHQEEQAKQDASDYKTVETRLETVEEEYRASLGKHKNKLAGLMESFGTLDHDALEQRVLDLQKLKGLNTQNVLHIKQQLNDLTNIHHFFQAVHASISSPTSAAELQGTSKTRPIFNVLLAEHGLVPREGQDPDSPANFAQYLLRECQYLSEDEGLIKKAIKAFNACGITPEQLCGPCGMDEKEREKAKRDLWKRMSKRLVESKKDYQALERQVARQKKKNEDKAEKLEELRAKGEGDDHHEKDVEKLEAEVDKEEEKLEELQDKLEAMKSKEEESEEIELVKDLMERVVDACHSTFKKVVAKYTLQALMTDLRIYHQHVHKPMQSLVQSIETTKNEYLALSSSATFG